MNRLLPLLWLVLAAALPAQEPADTVTLLLKGGLEATGQVLRIEEDGVLLRREISGEIVDRLWTWDQIDDADPLKPARQVGAPGLIAGVEVQDGAYRVRGVVVSQSEELLVVRNHFGNHRFDPTRVRTTEVWLAEREVLDDDELRARYAPGQTPATPSDHRRAAAEAARLGQDEEANDLLRVAEVLSEVGRPDQEVFRRIGQLRVETPERAQDAWELRRRVLDQSYEEAIRLLERMLGPDPAMEGVRSELTALRALPVAARMVLFHDAAAAETLWSLARNGSISWEAASRQVREELTGEIHRRMADRFSIDAETARRAWDQRPDGRQVVVSWGAGSFLAAGDAAGADREAWWSAASAEERYATLRGLFSEVSGQVLEVVTKDCAGCGGRGEAGGQTCKRCAGHRTERMVICR